MAEEEAKREEKKEGEGEGEKKKGGIFGKHTTLWIVGGVGAAGVLLLLFMNGSSNNNQQQSGQSQGSTDLSTQGAGGAVDTSSLVGTGGAPSWYNPGAAENLDYWPYPTTGNTSSSSGGSKSGSGGSSSSGSKSSSGGSKSSSGGSKSSSGGSKSSSGGSKSSSGGSKSGSGGVSHGTSHGVSKGKKKVNPNPHAGGAHGYVYTTKKGDSLASLQNKFFYTSNGSDKQGNLMHYGNNAKLIKQGMKSGAIDKNGRFKPGFKLNA